MLDETAYLSLDGENIVCRTDESEKFRIPFSNVEDIYCFSYRGCSPALMGKCVEYKIPLNFISPQGEFLARVEGEVKGNVYLRKAQFDMFADPPALLMQNTVAAKLANTRYVIKRSLRDNPQIDDDGAVSRCIAYLESSIDRAYETDDRDALMGIEGSAAKAYFDIFDRLILRQKEDFIMTSRTKRPPLDRVNAMLSYLYTIATCTCASALAAVGLDSYAGFYHALRPGRNSLACDMVEEIRCIIERLVLTMINLKMVNADDFEVQPGGAVYLSKDGKRKVITQWQEKKRTVIVHTYLKEKIPVGLIPYAQSTLLAKYIRGEIDEYPCFLMK